MLVGFLCNSCLKMRFWSAWCDLWSVVGLLNEVSDVFVLSLCGDGQWRPCLVVPFGHQFHYYSGSKSSMDLKFCSRSRFFICLTWRKNKFVPYVLVYSATGLLPLCLLLDQEEHSERQTYTGGFLRDSFVLKCYHFCLIHGGSDFGLNDPLILI